MARALYKEGNDIYLFDGSFAYSFVFKQTDPLSAVDQHVQKTLFSSILNYLHGKTRILVTHQLQLLTYVDKVMVMQVIRKSKHSNSFDRK
jgi:ABC-type transport system involved in cytochrome bd biosynthesis fused ATPase/permease subunit